MMMLGLCSAVPALAQSAFCVVSGGGTQCNYSDANYCRQVAQQSNGMCVANQQQQQPVFRQPMQMPAQREVVQPIYPDFAGGIMRAQQAADDSQLRHEQIKLLRLQQQAVGQQPSARRLETNDGYWVMYRCPTSNGGTEHTGTPAPGCIVDFVTKY